MQAKAKDLTGRLVGRLGLGLSQVYFDNDEGRYVVALSPRGSEQQTRAALVDLDLAGSEIQRAELDHRELNLLVDALSQRLSKVITSGHATVALQPAGVEINVAAGASARERLQVEEAARTRGAFVTRSAKDNLSVPPAACNGSWPDGRFCSFLVGGARYFTAAGGCSLGWWAGPYADPSYSPYFLTAGHCVTPGGTTWQGCDAAHNCYLAGYEAGQYYGGSGGDNGLLAISNPGWDRRAGYIDWRDGARQPITYYEYYPPKDTMICQGGATTGYSCGIVESNNMTVRNGASLQPCANCWPETWLTNMIVTKWICVQPGDSGGPVFTADMRGAVGINSAGTCNELSHTEPIWRAIQNYGVWPYGG